METRFGNQIFFVVVMMTCLVSCQKSDPAPTSNPQTSTGSTYLIMGNDLSGTSGSIATYVSGTTTLNTNYASTALADMVMDNGKLYASAKGTKTIDFLDPKSFSTTKSPAFGKDTKNFPNYRYKHMTVATGKVFISDLVNVSGVNKCFLKVMSIADPTRVDSVSIEAEAIIVSLLAVNNKIFVSTMGNYFNNSYIFVIDAGSYNILSKISVTTPSSQLMVDADNNVMAIQMGNLLRVNSTDFSITQTPFYGTPLVEQYLGSLAASSATLDKDANKVYYISPAPQPAAAPYVLSVFDLTSKTSKNLTTAFINASTILFDKKNKMIAVGSANYDLGGPTDPKDPNKGRITFYNTEGKILTKVTMPHVPEKILILE